MEVADGAVKKQRRKIQIHKPTIQTREDDSLWQEVHRYAELVPFEAEPNLGRIQEIKEEIRNGTYLTPEVMEETAARLAMRFLTKE